MRVEILIFQGFDELDAIGPYEVLQHARKRGADVDTRLVSLDGPGEVRCANGLRVQSEGFPGAGGRPDLLIVAGGGWAARSPQGAWTEAHRPEMRELLAGYHDAGVIMAAVCSGAMLLAAAGLLCGRHGTTHWSAIEELRAKGTEIVEARVVDEEDIVTSGGITSGLDLGLWLVERFFGARLAAETGRMLEFERRGPIWRREGQAARAGGNK
jgi:transcriptional regulator GlxA family with amidase domain